MILRLCATSLVPSPSWVFSFYSDNCVMWWLAKWEATIMDGFITGCDVLSVDDDSCKLASYLPSIGVRAPVNSSLKLMAAFETPWCLACRSQVGLPFWVPGVLEPIAASNNAIVSDWCSLRIWWVLSIYHGVKLKYKSSVYESNMIDSSWHPNSGNLIPVQITYIQKRGLDKASAVLPPLYLTH